MWLQEKKRVRQVVEVRKWVGWGELVPLSFNMYICRGSTSIGALLRQRS